MTGRPSEHGEEPKTSDGGESLDGAMEAAEALFWTPPGQLAILLGVSRSTIKRIRRRLVMLRGGSWPRVKDPPKQMGLTPGQSVEVENRGFPPSSKYFPLPPKGGIPPGENSKPGLGSKPKPKTPSEKTKTPCPADWQPRPDDRAYAHALGVDPERLRDTMVDWSAEDPTRNRKTSWDATYRNWARREGGKLAANQARLEAQRKNYLQARQEPPENALDRDATRRAKQERERRQEGLAIHRKYTQDFDGFDLPAIDSDDRDWEN
jgi:hypothetical protein